MNVRRCLSWRSGSTQVLFLSIVTARSVTFRNVVYVFGTSLKRASVELLIQLIKEEIVLATMGKITSNCYININFTLSYGAVAPTGARSMDFFLQIWGLTHQARLRCVLSLTLPLLNRTMTARVKLGWKIIFKDYHAILPLDRATTKKRFLFLSIFFVASVNANKISFWYFLFSRLVFCCSFFPHLCRPCLGVLWASDLPH